MQVFQEMDLHEFTPWSGGYRNYVKFTWDELDLLTVIFEEMYPDGISATELNDIFWFDPECLCDWIGLSFKEWEDRI